MLGKGCKAYWERMKGMLLENQRNIMKGLWGKNKGLLGKQQKAYWEKTERPSGNR